MLPYKHTLPHRRKINKRELARETGEIIPESPAPAYPHPAAIALPPGFAMTGRSGPKPGSVGQARRDYTAMNWQAI